MAAEFCGFMERVSDMRCRDFVDKSLKLLPLLYLKASLLPACERMEDADPETFVTETDYEVLRGSIASLLGEYDDYLEVFLDDMAYSDTPIHQNISESSGPTTLPCPSRISSACSRLGLEHTMNDSLAICRELFAEFWGQRLVNVMRALHDVKYRQLSHSSQEEEDSALYEDNCTEEELYEGLDMGDDE